MQFPVPTGSLGANAIVHTESWCKKLESQIHRDIKSFTKDAFDIQKMKAYAKSNPKYARSVIFFSLRNGTCTVEYPMAKPNERGFSSIDSRVHTFVRMFQDLAKWAKQHNLTLPEIDVPVYCCDTYAWEKDAQDFPWFVLAKPKNRKGILIPDDSFITHGLNGNLPLNKVKEWQWDQSLEAAKKIKGSQCGTQPFIFFQGTNTGASKWNTRHIVAKNTEHNPVFRVLLGKSKTDWPSWSEYGALLDLPGNQPWSYRRKYLHLLGRPVFQIDVERYKDAQDQDGTDRWIQFFDGLLQPYKHYVPSTVQYVEGEPGPTPQLVLMEASALHVRDRGKFSSKFTGRRVMMKLTSSHVLEYLYMTLWHCKLYFTTST